MADKLLPGDRRRDRCRSGRPALRRRDRPAGVLDGWLVDTSDAAALPALEARRDRGAGGPAVHARRRGERARSPAARARARRAQTGRRRLTGELTITGVRGLPDVRPGDDLAALIAAAAPDLRDGDIVVVTSKIVSKAEGRLVQADSREDAITAETVSRGRTTRPAAHRADPARSRAGRGRRRRVERRPGTVLLLPIDPDASARALRAALADRLGVRTAVIITDTAGRAWREGLVDIAIGVAGLDAARGPARPGGPVRQSARDDGHRRRGRDRRRGRAGEGQDRGCPGRRGARARRTWSPTRTGPGAAALIRRRRTTCSRSASPRPRRPCVVPWLTSPNIVG